MAIERWTQQKEHFVRNCKMLHWKHLPPVNWLLSVGSLLITIESLFDSISQAIVRCLFVCQPIDNFTKWRVTVDRRKPRIIVKRAIIQAFLFDHATSLSLFFLWCLSFLFVVLIAGAVTRLVCFQIREWYAFTANSSGVYLIITQGEERNCFSYFFSNICLSTIWIWICFALVIIIL